MVNTELSEYSEYSDNSTNLRYETTFSNCVVLNNFFKRCCPQQLFQTVFPPKYLTFFEIYDIINIGGVLCT